MLEPLEDDDFLFQLRDGSGGGGLIHKGFFEALLLLCVEVIVVFGDLLQCISKYLLAAYTELLLAQAAFEAFLAPFEGLKNGLRAGSEAALEGGERDADRAFLRACKLVGFTHLRL